MDTKKNPPQDPPYTANIYQDKDDIYNQDKRAHPAAEDPTTGDIDDSGSPLDPDAVENDDENITGDEDLYESVDNEDPADEKDVLTEQAEEEQGQEEDEE